MNIPVDQFEFGILQHLAQGKIPDESYRKQYGATTEEFGNIVTDMKEKHYIKGARVDCGISQSSLPVASLGGARVTIEGKNFMMEHLTDYPDMI